MSLFFVRGLHESVLFDKASERTIQGMYQVLLVVHYISRLPK